MKAIYIEWCDAVEKDYGWSSKAEVLEWAKTDNWVIKQYGFIVEETDKYIVLATRYSEDKDGEIMFGGIIKIPSTWILNKESLK